MARALKSSKVQLGAAAGVLLMLALLVSAVNPAGAAPPAQSTLPSPPATERVDLQVLELKRHQGFLIYSTVAGQPVDAELEAVEIAGRRDPTDFQDVTDDVSVNHVKPGVMQVRIEPDNPGRGGPPFGLPFNPIKELRQAEVIELRVSYDDGQQEHHGAVMFHENFWQNKGVGQ